MNFGRGFLPYEAGVGVYGVPNSGFAVTNLALKAGARQVADGVLNSANSTLMEGGLIDQPMTWENYASVSVINELKVK